MLGLFSRNDRVQTPWLVRLREGMVKTRLLLSGLFGGGEIDPAFFENLENALLASDVGVDATQFLLERLRTRVTRVESAEQLRAELREILVELLAPLEQPLQIAGAKPYVIMIVGVNGAGKTTSIGKLARYFQAQGFTVILAAGDTFRAAAREQLSAWGERNGVPVVAQSGGDPGAVVFDAVAAARARGIGVVLADTAGRLPTQRHLMEEAKKIRRVLAKAEPGAPHQTWLVLDANTGQNALSQLEAFDDALGLTGIVLTKLDGTAKGGVVCAIALAQSRKALAQSRKALAQSREALAQSKGTPGQSRDPRRRPVPLRFVGVGEGIDDLRPFVAREFVSALLD
jgi:fused signal recognition particle receptor